MLQRIMKMYHFADVGKTNPIKPNFQKAKNERNSFNTKDYEL